MAVAPNQHNRTSETKHPTKRVFMRAEHNDTLEICDVINTIRDGHIPDTATVVQRDLTYYGPKIRIEAHSNHEQYLLTAPGPNKEAMFWQYTEAGWEESAEVCLDFYGEIPQYDICPHCNEPISTVAHRRRSVTGTCKK
ncbi:hypothetical protein [Natrialba asiatica]|uniref:hypothetical protein n=1 Tax=Natrialba asiatica TaxID=64602 RepID=UPI0012690586|nr:hypothetical protein [Natrialba asiatica]